MADTPMVPAEFTPSSLSSTPDDAGETQRFMQQVYGWMAFALVVSGGIAYYVVHDANLLKWIFEKWLFMPLLLVELGLVMGLSWLIQKMNAITATIMFILYSFVTGLTLSVVFLVYELGSIVSIFGVTAAIFTTMSVYGYYTKRDLTGIGTLAFFGLIGIIIAGLVNLFVQNTMADFIISAIGVIVFIALTAYDTQKIKSMNIIGNEWTDEDKKEAIMWALTLYLDFINLFLKLLRLFGKRR
jgi:FtsH-binding integral membrane protein